MTAETVRVLQSISHWPWWRLAWHAHHEEKLGILAHHGASRLTGTTI